MENPIAVQKFHVYGTWKDGNPDNDHEVDTTLTLELWKSGAFQYGNGTTVVWIDESGFEQGYDTRYDKTLHRNGSNFGEWAEKFVKERVNDSLTVKRMA